MGNRLNEEGLRQHFPNCVHEQEATLITYLPHKKWFNNNWSKQVRDRSANFSNKNYHLLIDLLRFANEA